MSYELFEHRADIGVRGKGKTCEQAFEECAKAMFSAMVDVERVAPKKKVQFDAHASDLEALLPEFLNNLLYVRDVQGMVFSRFEVKDLRQGPGQWGLKASAWGEKFDPNRHEPKTEVKAATFYQLSVRKTPQGFVAECVVDV
ncbi:MAG: archease [Candidatus Diapherotrites archaeon]|nr:archease [Candidatus Diapherotrites archaeon]